MLLALQHDARRVFVARRGDLIELRDGDEVVGTFSAETSAEGDRSKLSGLREMLAGGVRLRPRALATTLFSRLCLADLFLHGIGGAKYDEMTDALGQEFFGLEMPAFLTLTGSRWLPLGGGVPTATSDWRAAQRDVRDSMYNAERFLSGGATTELVDEKQRLVAELKELKAARQSGRTARTVRRDVARRLKTVEQQMAALAAPRRPLLEDRRRHCEEQVAANRILQSREFAAVLHPMPAYAEWVAQIREAVGAAGK